MRLTHVHPGVSPDRVRAKTGFPLDVAPDLRESEPPSDEEVHLLREVIDPLGVRRLEFLSGTERRELLRALLEQEASVPAR
jgi:hypothetical protein